MCAVITAKRREHGIIFSIIYLIPSHSVLLYHIYLGPNKLFRGLYKSLNFVHILVCFKLSKKELMINDHTKDGSTYRGVMECSDIQTEGKGA